MNALPNELFNDVDSLIESRRISNEFRKKGLFCDTTLKTIDGTEFKVHKLILSTSCTYFRSLFEKESAWKETKSPLSVIPLDRDITSECFEMVLEYLYTGKVEINSGNALLLHEGAVYFNLKNLKKIVTKFPIQRIQMDTVLDLWRYGIKFYNFEIEEKCLEFINENCEKFLNDHLKMLDSSEIKKISSLKNLKLPQDDLYIFLTNWIKEDFPNREYHLRSLLNNINFNLIKDEVKIRNILSDTTLLQSKDFLELMVKNYHESLIHVDTNNQHENALIGTSSKLLYKIDLSGEQGIFTSILKHEKTNSDYIVHTTSNKKYLLFLYVDNSQKCQWYNPKTNKINQFPTLPTVVRKLCGIANLSNRIFVVGGTGFKSTEILDIDAGTWIQGADLLEVRSAFSLTSAENALYAIGGLKGDNTNHDTIEKFDLIEKKWVALTVPDCNIGFNHAVCYNKKIYCFTNKDERIYDIAENNFKSLTSKQPVVWENTSFNVAYNDVDSFCYVFGQHKSNEVIRYAIFKYKFDDSTWEDLKIEFPSELDGNLKISVLNVPLAFKNIKLFNWISGNN